ncbi:MAG: alpha/beta hydrolase-fold protein [Myxococcota bacterium]|nr:alpha/beta hydrolase-fold protein [Myxococcota bacterium]
MLAIQNLKSTVSSFTAGMLLATALVGNAQAQQDLTQEQQDLLLAPAGRISMTIGAPIMMKSTDFEWAHQILVALPASYDTQPDKKYPVLWVTDGNSINLPVGILELLVSAGLAPEMIIVGVGMPSELGMAEFVRRRITDFAPPGDKFFADGVAGDALKNSQYGAYVGSLPRKGDKFLDFLIDEVRPALAKKYRMSGDHGLYGHSAGGMFTGYAIFARPGDFSKYIVGSPSLFAVDRKAFQLEEEYAKNHKDLNVSVFFGAGELEIHNTFLAGWSVVSSPVLMAETLQLRQYPSLKVTTRIFHGKDHATVVPETLRKGITTLWADDAVPITYAGQSD